LNVSEAGGGEIPKRGLSRQWLWHYSPPEDMLTLWNQTKHSSRLL